MDRDPLALPGDPGYLSETDSDIEVIPDDNCELVNSSCELKIQLVEADMSYVNKITGQPGKRGRKKKEEKVIATGNSQLKVQLIGPKQTTNGKNAFLEIESETDEIQEFKVNGRGGGKRGKKPGRPKKKKDFEENYFKSNRNSTHHSRSSRYEQLQEKKDEFLQQESVRKAAFREKHQKYVDRAKQKYLEKKAQTDPHTPTTKPEMIFPRNLQKKMYRRICMLAMKLHHVDKSKSKDELVNEMALEWKTNRDQFWENYKKRWKEVAFRRVKPMTAERAEFLRKRGQQIDQIKQELTQTRVSTRGKTKDYKDFDSPGSSMMGYNEEDEEEPNVINYAEFMDDEESFNDESFLLAANQDHFSENEAFVENDTDAYHLLDYASAEDQMPYDEGLEIGMEGFPTETDQQFDDEYPS